MDTSGVFRNRALQVPPCVIIGLIADRVDADETIELLKPDPVGKRMGAAVMAGDEQD